MKECLILFNELCDMFFLGYSRILTWGSITPQTDNFLHKKRLKNDEIIH